MIIINILLFFISSIGYWKLIKNKTNIDIHFVPALTILLQIFILFIAGILNCLFEVSLVLYILGVVLFIYYLIKQKNDFIKEYKNTDFILFSIIILILGLFLSDKYFSHFDNFSHWATVVKSMLITNRYPNFLDTVIEFQQYPLGSSTYIYFFSRFTAITEPIQMFAQCYMLICLLFPLLKYINKNKIISYTFFVLILNFILCYHVQLSELLVDTLLPIIAVYQILFIYEEGYKSNNKHFFKLMVPLLSALLLIKNSSIFFIFVEVILIIYLMKKKNLIKSIKHWCIVLSPIITFFIWNRHCAYVYPKAAFSKHSMTLTNFINTSSDKSINDILTITEKVFQQSFICKELLILICFILIIGILVFIFNRKNSIKYCKLCGFLGIIYITYVFGTSLMYIFSMPGTEADTLAEINRYLSSIQIFIYKILSAYCIKLINNSNKYKLISIVLISSAILLNLLIHDELRTIINIQPVDDARIRFENSLKQNETIDFNDETGLKFYLYRYLTLN